MSSLQEVLTLLLGAESEARRKTEEARVEAEGILTGTRQAFQREREDRIASARDQAGALIESSEKTADAEARQILAMGQQETRSIAERFESHARDIVHALVDETALQYLRKGIR